MSQTIRSGTSSGTCAGQSALRPHRKYKAHVGNNCHSREREWASHIAAAAPSWLAANPTRALHLWKIPALGLTLVHQSGYKRIID
eukprot:4622526-Amphidinium_carterae.1